MSKMKTYIESWLENYGWDLGYDMDSLPEMRDMDYISTMGIDADSYFKPSSSKDMSWEKMEDKRG